MSGAQSLHVSLNKVFFKKNRFQNKKNPVFGEITSIEENENQLLFCHIQ